jgi:lysophospholipase L1-like esterase
MSVIPAVTSSHIVLAYANITSANNLGEWSGDTNVKVTAALEYLAAGGPTSETGLRVAATFNGQKFGEMAPGAVLYSDPIPFDAVAGTQFFVRTNFQTTGSNLLCPVGFAPQGGTGPGGLGNGEAATSFAATINGSIGTATLTAFTYPGPVAVLGYVSGHIPTAAILGDSIMAGVGDEGFGRNDGGYLVRALTNQLGIKNVFPTTPKVPFIRLARSGETLQSWLTNASGNQFGLTTASVVRAKIADLASTILFEYGTNDLGSSLTTIKANYIAAANSFLRRGKYFVACTLLPKTTSTDAFMTVANQTLGANEADRVAFNTWLRNGTFAAATINPAACAVFDAAAAVEVNSSNVLTLNGGFWKAEANGGVPAVSSTVTSGSTTSVTNDSTQAWTQDQWRGYTLIFTSGALANTANTILSNTATALNTGTMSAAAATGDAYKIVRTYTKDGTHPTSTGHAAIAAAFNLGLVK